MTNLRLVLRPGIPAQPITGSPAVPTVFIQFKDGLAQTENEEIIEMLQHHKDFNRVFIQVEEGVKPAFEANKSAEPVHVLSDIEHGKSVNRRGNPVGVNPDASKKMQEAINEQAKAMAMAMLPELLKAVQEGQTEKETTVETSEETVKEEVEEKVETKPKNKTSKPKSK